MVTIPKSLSCVCGNEGSYKFHKQLYEVTVEGVTQPSDGDAVEFVGCDKCGVVRQGTQPYLTDKEYKQYYAEYPPVTEAYGVKGYQHDREVAEKRFKSSQVQNTDRVLDVGSGSGAFVDVAREKGVEAYGCELLEYFHHGSPEFIYKKALEDIHFPTDHFDKVTCFDVLEHTMHPETFLKEILRVLKVGGECTIEVPDFFCEEGKHHWKEEHIWFFTVAQLKDLASKVGFDVYGMDKPISSKMVLYLKKPKQDRVSILVPPGMGDAYWSIVKLESFMESIGRGGEVADIYVACNKDRIHNGHKRAFPFIKLFPFLKSTGISYNTNEYPQELWLEAYRDCGRTIFPNILDCDYLLSWNAYMGAGNNLEDIDSHLKCNWIPDMFESLEQTNYMKLAQKQYGKYIVFYFIFHGHYIGWMDDFPIDKVCEAVKLITAETGCTPVFTGAVWDEENDILGQLVKMTQKEVPETIDLRGKTSIEQLFGLIKGSECVVGYPSGLTIMSTALRQKTYMIWNKFYNDDFRWRSCPPEVRHKTYFVGDTKGITPQNLTTSVKDLLGGRMR